MDRPGSRPARWAITSTTCEPGGVVVLDNGGRENATVWGDILTMVAHTRGVAGTVIDGACRDVASRAANWAIRSSAAVTPCAPARIACRWRRWAAPVNIGDARVDAGDILRGDADGVVAIPRAHEDAILANAEEIDAVEVGNPPAGE